MKKRRLFYLIYFFCAAAAVFSFYFLYISKDGLPKDIQAVSNVDFSVPYLNGTSAGGVALTDANTGALLYGKNEDVPLPMASTTKIMTALVVLENFDITKTVTVPRMAQGIEGSSMYLKEGERFTVRELLYGLLLSSGNDAAVALAHTCSGSVDAFVQMMNEKAAQLGLENTHFDNPHGLSSQTHYTTARELSQIAAYAMKNEEFAKIVSTKSTYIPKTQEREGRYLSNHNKLLYMYPDTVGIKTGYTIAAGRCLVSAVKRGDATFIAVTLNDRNDWRDHSALYDFAFENFESKKIVSKNTPFFVFCNSENTQEIRGVCESDVYLTYEKGKDVKTEVEIKIEKTSAYLAKSGEKIGTATLFANGEMFYSCDLIKK